MEALCASMAVHSSAIDKHCKYLEASPSIQLGTPIFKLTKLIRRVILMSPKHNTYSLRTSAQSLMNAEAYGSYYIYR